MSTFVTDNRWSAGSMEDKVPDTALAVYGARWIDHGSRMDVVPDRQGFAYNNAFDRETLIEQMMKADLQDIATAISYDDEGVEITPEDVNFDGFHAWMRRAGGYVYVAAWIEAIAD